MNHDTMVLLIRAMLTCLDHKQASDLIAWLNAMSDSLKPEEDVWDRGANISRAINEINTYAGKTP